MEECTNPKGKGTLEILPTKGGPKLSFHEFYCLHVDGNALEGEIVSKKCGCGTYQTPSSTVKRWEPSTLQYVVEMRQIECA